MVPNAQSPLLHQSSSHPLGLSVQLDTGCSARHRALGNHAVTLSCGAAGSLLTHCVRPTGSHRAAGRTDLGIQQQKQRVVGSGVGPPLQHVRQEQELRREAPSVLLGFAREAPSPPSQVLACYLPGLVAVFQVGQLPPGGLCNSFPSNQVPNNHGGWSDL